MAILYILKKALVGIIAASLFVTVDTSPLSRIARSLTGESQQCNIRVNKQAYLDLQISLLTKDTVVPDYDSTGLAKTGTTAACPESDSDIMRYSGGFKDRNIIPWTYQAYHITASNSQLYPTTFREAEPCANYRENCPAGYELTSEKEVHYHLQQQSDCETDETGQLVYKMRLVKVTTPSLYYCAYSSPGDITSPRGPPPPQTN